MAKAQFTSATSATAGGSSARGITGGGSGGGFPEPYIQAYIDAKIEAAATGLEMRLRDQTTDMEARLQQRAGDLEDRIRAQTQSIRDDLAKKATTGSIWGAAATVITALVAILAFAGSRFDGGMSVRSSVDHVVSEQHERDDSQDRKLNEILARLPKTK